MTNHSKIDAAQTYYWCSPCGHFELEFPGQAILDMTQGGRDADPFVKSWEDKIVRPMGASKIQLVNHLAGFGAWEAHEMGNDAENWRRTIWTAACDVYEEEG